MTAIRIRELEAALAAEKQCARLNAEGETRRIRELEDALEAEAEARREAEREVERLKAEQDELPADVVQLRSDLRADRETIRLLAVELTGRDRRFSFLDLLYLVQRGTFCATEHMRRAMRAYRNTSKPSEPPAPASRTET